MNTSSLQVENLQVEFETRHEIVRALHGISFTLEPGQTLALVGESGSGKSVASLTIMGLLERNGRISDGCVRIGQRVLASPALRRPHGPSGLAMVFQYPRTALNPIRTVGAQLCDVLRQHTPLRGRVLRAEALRILEEVHIADAERRLGAYPFELSGGMCQRILIAIALAKRPAFLLADEPTTGLDVLTQRSIMELIDETRVKHGMGTLLITHDLGLAREHSDHIIVMQKGSIVESKTTEELFRRPEHPYTRDLIHSTPGLSSSLAEFRQRQEEAYA